MRRHPIEQAILQASAHTAPWLLAVSGGADSMALLHACSRSGVDAEVVHCNFQLRGEESERDMEFVERACQLLRLPLHVARFDTLAYSREHNKSLELACRELRYARFRELMGELGLKRVAVAHNADDDNETMLMNLLRGTGIAGLTGMKPDGGEIIRPLLSFTRKEIVDYLHLIGKDWITDSSNLSSDFRRNFVRNEVIPLLLTRWPGMGKALARTRRHLLESSRLASTALGHYLASATDRHIPASMLRESPAPTMLVREWLGNRAATPTQIEDMIRGGAGAEWHVEDGIVRKDKSGLTFYPDRQTAGELVMEIIDNTPSVRKSLKSLSGNSQLYTAPAEGLVLRPSRPADRIHPLGMSGSTPVGKVLKDAGVPRDRREGFPIVADAYDRVVWIPGIKRSNLYLVTADSSYIQKFTYG